MCLDLFYLEWCHVIFLGFGEDCGILIGILSWILMGKVTWIVTQTEIAMATNSANPMPWLTNPDFIVLNKELSKDFCRLVGFPAMIPAAI